MHRRFTQLREFFELYGNRRVMTMLGLGFSSGLPLALTGSTLQAWMTVEKVDLSLIGLFSLVGLPYTVKVAWSPLLDRFAPPWLGRRRGWIVISQVLLACGIALLGFSSPQRMPGLLAFARSDRGLSQRQSGHCGRRLPGGCAVHPGTGGRGRHRGDRISAGDDCLRRHGPDTFRSFAVAHGLRHHGDTHAVQHSDHLRGARTRRTGDPTPDSGGSRMATTGFLLQALRSYRNARFHHGLQAGRRPRRGHDDALSPGSRFHPDRCGYGEQGVSGW